MVAPELGDVERKMAKLKVSKFEEFLQVGVDCWDVGIMEYWNPKTVPPLQAHHSIAE